MHILLLVPFALQGIAIGVDEIYFHHKRGLPKWERIGHPIDTFSVLICLVFTLFIPYSAAALKTYIGLSIFSSLCVTKDEFVHKHHCPASENWLHAVLFTLHPIVLTVVGLIWAALSNKVFFDWTMPLLQNPNFLKTLLYAQVFSITLFLVYQIIFWNFIWKEKIVIKH